MKRLFWILILLLAGCASQSRRSTVSLDRPLMFPNGTYQHAVEVVTAGNSRHFNGVVKLSAEQVLVIGLSPMNSTVFRITEDRKSGKVQSEVFHSALKPHEAKLIEFYEMIRVMMASPLLTANEKSDQSSVTRVEKGIELVFSKFDQNRIPLEIVIKHPKFRVEVGVKDYEI